MGLGREQPQQSMRRLMRRLARRSMRGLTQRLVRQSTWGPMQIEPVPKAPLPRGPAAPALIRVPVMGQAPKIVPTIVLAPVMMSAPAPRLPLPQRWKRQRRIGPLTRVPRPGMRAAPMAREHAAGPMALRSPRSLQSIRAQMPAGSL
jgi:hypothetical protein